MKQAQSKVTYCKNCKHGGEIKNFLVFCTKKGIYQHSPVGCKEYKKK